MRPMPRLICILLVLALLLGACSSPPPQETEHPALPVALWLWDGLPMCAALRALVVEYNDTQPERPVSLRVFSSEAALGGAMNEARPDLLLCSAERASSLYEQGKLLSSAPGVELSPAFASAGEGVGSSFFPLGAEIPLLAVNDGAYLSSPVAGGTDALALSGAESLLSLAAAHGSSTGQPFFAADSWADLFETLLLQGGERFLAQRAQLRESERAAALYNALAEAYAHGLYLGAEDPLRLVQEGQLAAALVGSRRLVGAEAGLSVYPAPRLADGEAILPATVWGLAVTAPSEEMARAAEPFLAWLYRPEHAAALALDEGLLPAVSLPAGEDPAPTLDSALLLTGESFLLRPAEGGSGWELRSEDFDEALRAALALLD